MVQNNIDRIGLNNVINLNDLKHYLNNFKDGNYYFIEEMDEIYNRLMAASSRMINIEHIENVR